MNSMMPAINWATPPNIIMSPTMTLGVLVPPGAALNIEIRKMLVAKARSPSGAGLAKLRGTYGSAGWSRGEMVACASRSAPTLLVECVDGVFVIVVALSAASVAESAKADQASVGEGERQWHRADGPKDGAGSRHSNGARGSLAMIGSSSERMMPYKREERATHPECLCAMKRSGWSRSVIFYG